MKAIRLLLVIASFILLSQASAQFPVTVTDDLGREVTLPHPPQRVVSMLASGTEIACAIAACDLLVGVDQFSNYPPEVTGLPHLGSAFTPNLESLVSLEPDLVLVDEDSGIAATLDSLGIPNVAFTGQSLAELYGSIESIGLVLDRREQAAELVTRLRGDLAAIAELTEGLEAPRVFFELDATPYSVGPGSFIDELIALAGGENVVGEGFGPFPQVDPEYVVSVDPEVVVLADAPFGTTAAAVAQRPGWARLGAVENGRVVELGQTEVDMLSRPGPRVVQAVELLAKIFHPDAF